eukprot:Hpha_TRINITY_DN16172_c1_g5::TRINITY_DN16172_c1_g5_i1::g.7826::m.7826
MAMDSDENQLIMGLIPCRECSESGLSHEDSNLELPEPSPQLRPLPTHDFLIPVHEKWSLKNGPKWTATICGGERLGKSRLVPIKSWLEGDMNHSPEVFFSRVPGIGLVIDLTATPASYDTDRFGDAPYIDSKGIPDDDKRLCCYRKLSGISKQVPSEEEVVRFCDTIRQHLENFPSDLIVVHCHYGFNRTGFMCVSYLVEECGYGVDEAVRCFADVRPPGIKHVWFVSELQKRYEGHDDNNNDE